MINKEDLEKLVKDILSKEKNQFEDQEIFFVNCKISADNRISVYIDSLKDVGIKDCVILSKNIESQFDRDKEDYELMVSSAGLDQPFLVIKQYQKNIGKHIKIKDSEGKNLKGELLSVSESGIKIRKINKISKSKKSSEIKEEIELSFDRIKEAKVVITF